MIGPQTEKYVVCFVDDTDSLLLSNEARQTEGQTQGRRKYGRTGLQTVRRLILVDSNHLYDGRALSQVRRGQRSKKLHELPRVRHHLIIFGREHDALSPDEM
jgi:hypothetical protein